MSYMRRYAAPTMVVVPMASGKSRIVPRQALGDSSSMAVYQTVMKAANKAAGPGTFTMNPGMTATPVNPNLTVTPIVGRRAPVMQRSRTATMALGSNQSMPRTFRTAPRSLDGVSPRAMSAAQRFGVMGTLGDAATTDSTPTIVDPVVALQQQQLAQMTIIANSQVAFAKQESFQRYLQIGATLLIPVSAAIWRALFRGGRKVAEDVGA